MVCSVCEFFFPSLVGEHYLMHMEGYVEQGMRKELTILISFSLGCSPLLGFLFVNFIFPTEENNLEKLYEKNSMYLRV